MSSRIRQTISFALVLAMLSIGMTTANAQRRPYRMNDRQVDELIRRVETSADRFRATLANALDRSVYDGSRQEDNINSFVQSFETATDQLRERFNRRVSVASDVENVLRQASDINSFMLRNRLTQRAQNEWNLVRNDLNTLAQAYGVAWQWNQVGSQSGSNYPPVGVPSRINDRQVATIIGRIETRTDSFRASIDRGLDRSVYDGTRAENNINQFVRDFETATDTLRERFNGRRSVASDVENVLQRAASIDDFMRRNRLGRRAENEWSLLRTDLNELATAYNVAWNWDSTTLPAPGGGYTASNRLTGTYRLDPSRSDNARDAAERAARTLPLGDRQRVSERLASRLESPEMLAIERNGSRVTIASSRAVQTTFDADGRESREQLPNGMTSRVTASLAGERLTVRSTGDRANDFSVTFEPINGGRQLHVTREIWNERLGNVPVVVRNVYDRTSDVADFNVYNGSTASTTYPSGPTGAYGDYAIRNGEMLVAALNTDLTSRTAQVGDRFTMTVREPSQYRGAIIEGRVANVSRSGRVTGRSDMSLDFENIRTPDGRSYRFAGFIESVRTVNGETVQVDNEGTVRDDDSRGTTTAQRAAIGTAVGAIIGAIAGGGKGAAIGAIVGAAGGAGSVYVQGREDIELLNGSELTIRASAPPNR